MSLIEFELTPVAEIEPWGCAPDLSLHWFGLSYGSYHLEAGRSLLLEYASAEGWPRFVNYQLARLHEDLIAMLPDVIDEVPSEVVRHFLNGSLGATVRHLRQVWIARDGVQDSHLDTAVEVLGARALDTGYLNPSAGIWVWSMDAKTVIEWDNRRSAPSGEASVDGRRGPLRITSRGVPS